MAKIIDISYWKSLLITVIVATIGWAILDVVRTGVKALLLRWGITSVGLQGFIIIFGGFILLGLLGFGVKAAIDKSIGR